MKSSHSKQLGPRERSRTRAFVRERSGFAPAYLEAHRGGLLQRRIEEASLQLQRCQLCPRGCAVDRSAGELGVCRTGALAGVACAFPHHGEEACLRGSRGSGTLFLAQCNLRCVFCQNYETSHLESGRPVTPAELARLMVELQLAGCHNINFVTPSHVVPQLLAALPAAIEAGLRVPLVYNSSGYDSLKALQLLDGVVDIYMPDFKLWTPALCEKYLLAHDYAEVARVALREMHRQVGDLVFDEDGLALRGALVRHLVMPGLLEDTRNILQFLASELSPDTYVNLMDQYHPAGRVPHDPALAAIDRSLDATEYHRALDCAHAAGLWRLDDRG